MQLHWSLSWLGLCQRADGGHGCVNVLGHKEQCPQPWGVGDHVCSLPAPGLPQLRWQQGGIRSQRHCPSSGRKQSVVRQIWAAARLHSSPGTWPPSVRAIPSIVPPCVLDVELEHVCVSGQACSAQQRHRWPRSKSASLGKQKKASSSSNAAPWHGRDVSRGQRCSACGRWLGCSEDERRGSRANATS